MSNDDFTNRLQKEIKENKLRDEILNKIKENPDILNSFSDERLDQIIVLQEQKIKELDREIAEAKRKLGYSSDSDN